MTDPKTMASQGLGDGRPSPEEVPATDCAGARARSVIEAVTVVRYRAVGSLRRRRLRSRKGLAYRDAAWAKIRSRCECEYPVKETDPPPSHCKYHDKDYRSVEWPGGYEEPPWHGFMAAEAWRLPRADEQGFWDYGRAVAFRLARFYAHIEGRRSEAA